MLWCWLFWVRIASTTKPSNAEPAWSVSLAAERTEPCNACLQALRLPLITGYVLGGVLVGPFGLNLLRAEGLPSLAVVRARRPQTPPLPLGAPCDPSLRRRACLGRHAHCWEGGRRLGLPGARAPAPGARLAPGVHCACRGLRCARGGLRHVRAGLCCARAALPRTAGGPRLPGRHSLRRGRGAAVGRAAAHPGAGARKGAAARSLKLACAAPLCACHVCAGRPCIVIGLGREAGGRAV